MEMFELFSSSCGSGWWAPRSRVLTVGRGQERGGWASTPSSALPLVCFTYLIDLNESLK